MSVGRRGNHTFFSPPFRAQAPTTSPSASPTASPTASPIPVNCTALIGTTTSGASFYQCSTTGSWCGSGISKGQVGNPNLCAEACATDPASFAGCFTASDITNGFVVTGFESNQPYALGTPLFPGAGPMCP